jgi:hypothetical protein
MRNNKNLNEEIKRMKSLFGDNLLYGNLVDNFLVEDVKGSLSIGNPKTIAQFLETLIKSFKSSGKKQITSNINGVKTTYSITKEGKILKNGKQIDDLTNITNFISDALNSKITRQIEEIGASEKNLPKYLSGEGVNGITLEKHINEIIDDLFAQNLINEGTSQKFKNSLKSTRIFQAISEIFENDTKKGQFINGITSDLYFGKNYPEIYELFNNIPKLKDNFYKTMFDEGKLISGEYDSFITISLIIKKYKGKDGDGSVLIPWNSYFDKSKKISLEYDSINKELTLISVNNQQLPKDLKNTIQKEINELKNVDPNIQIKINNNGNITFSVKNIKRTEIESIGKMINNGDKIPEKTISANVPVRTKSMDFGEGDILDDRFLSKRGDSFTQYYNQYITNILKTSKVAVIDIINAPSIIKMRDIFTTKMSRFLDPNYLRNNGYISTTSKGPKQIDENWQNVLNSIWKVDTPIKGTTVGDIFIKTEEEALLYGIQIGGIKPNLVKHSDWNVTFRNEFKKTYFFMTFGLKGNYRGIATDKLMRNYFLQIGSATTIVELIRNYSYYKLTILKWWIESQIESGKKFFMGQWQGQDVNPNTMLPLVQKSYEKKCKDDIKKTIIRIFGNTGEAIFKTYFGSEGELKDITKIKVTPTNFGGEDYNDTDNLPNLESVEYDINTMNLDGKVYKDFGEIKKENDNYFLITIPLDGKISKIPLNCTPDFVTFWVESWKEIYKLKNDEGAMKKKMREIGNDIDWENLNEGNFLTEIGNSIDKITIGTITDGIETSLEKVKDVGEKGAEFLQDKLPDGGSGGGMGEFGEF